MSTLFPFPSSPRRRGSSPVEPKAFFVYILTNKRNGTLYIGVTSDLPGRVHQHKNDLVDGFSRKYQTHFLVYFEEAADASGAITREKQLKKWNRSWKIELIEKQNPHWKDLSLDF